MHRRCFQFGCVIESLKCKIMHVTFGAKFRPSGIAPAQKESIGSPIFPLKSARKGIEFAKMKGDDLDAKEEKFELESLDREKKKCGNPFIVFI